MRERLFSFRPPWPLLAGALLGIVLRLIFSGDPDGRMSVMGGPFIYFAPVAVGAVTVYLAERRARLSWGRSFNAGALANLAFVLGTLLVLIEGLICAVLILPLFMVLGGMGGLLMAAVCRLTRWPRHTAYSLAALPLLVGSLLPAAPSAPRLHSVERSVVVHAPAEKIWPQLLNAPNIQPGEVGHAWMYRIGVPLPESGITQNTPDGLVRHVRMGKAIHFEQVSTEWREGRHLRWTYRFAPDSFPPHALDDHVRIGGRYFDLIDTDYDLTPRGDGSTLLSVRMRYRVNTDFDWYADRVAQMLIGNFEEVILGFYRERSIAMTVLRR